MTIDRGTPQQKFLKTDSMGQLNFDLSVGHHEIRVYSQGFREDVLKVQLRPGEIRELHSALQVGSGGGVLVTPIGPDLQPETAHKLANLAYQRLERVPLPSRKFKSHRFWR